jgi:gamma-glutamylcyclotransferase (GGCT)/AIG2-like uncharacterized protein YtfP
MSRTVYFAYGSNMDAHQMEHRCPTAALIGTGVLDGWRFRIMTRGYATVVPEVRSSVWGVLWDLQDEDVASLDRYEGVAEGLYAKQVTEVVETTGRSVEALVYVAADTEPGVPSPSYMGRVVAAARDSGLPDDYIAELESWT